MPIINNPFNGKMNLDVADYRIDNGDYIDAMNITKDAQGVGQDRVISNILGNTYIPYTLPSGDNKVIGFYPDKVRNRAYYFLYNTNGYNSIIYYDLSNNTVVKVLESKTDSDGIDILNFNPSYKVTSVNIFYRDDEGDLLFFNDNFNPPKYINVTEYHGTSWKLEYILVAKAPPVMPPKVTYENDTDITINNLRNKLFQFSYRYVYVNNEKSVWSSKSIVPLPQQPTLLLTDNVATNNARIAVIFSTGGKDVRAIEVSFRETTNGLTSDWYLIKSFNKNRLSINNDDVYYFKFYNDAIYSQIDVIESNQLQDWVPQKANASELANGNVLLYSGILEGYDKTTMDLSVTQDVEQLSYFYDQAGLLFFASVNGSDNGVGTIMDIYLYGTGTNGVDGTVTILNNSAGGYYVNSFAANGTDLSTSYSTIDISTSHSISSLLSGISAAMVLKGYSQVSLVGNHLRMSLSGGFVLTSTGYKEYRILNANNTKFASVWNSGYQYAIQYFDAQGRTIGAQTSSGGTINTLAEQLIPIIPDTPLAQFPKIYLSILNRPPLYATYYQVLRSNNTTYNKRLCWISESAYAGITDGITNARYFYIGIGNIAAYNESISSTQNVVSYNYTEGDRIKFIRRYDASNFQVNIPEQYDYEIIGTISTINYNIADQIPADNNTYTAIGNFLKIRYPNDDISADFKFPGTADWQHYEILLYNYTSNASATQRLFYEFGKEYGIGNPGTDSRYHFGLTQLPNGGATIPVSNGDLFYRWRSVPYDFLNAIEAPTTQVIWIQGSTDAQLRYAILNVTNSPIQNTAYNLQSQSGIGSVSLTTGAPQFSDTNYLFWNKLGESNTLNIKSSFSVSQNWYVAVGDVAPEKYTVVFSMYAIICTSTDKYYITLLNNEFNNLLVNKTYEYTIEKSISVPENSKLWVCFSSKPIGTLDLAIGEYNAITITPYTFNFNIVRNSTIGIIESSFNDTYNLVTNSNGRPSVIDINAKKTYYPTLIRFGGAYQVDTNINQLNNFKFENFDEYDRSFGDVIRLHVRDRYLKVYQKFKVGNVPILTQIVKDSANNPLQANTDTLINKIQYYAGDYGIGDAATSLAWNNFADYFVDNYRGVVCRLSQDGIVPISITNNTNAFFVPNLTEYRQELNNGVPADGQPYMGNPCIYGVFDAYTNKYILALEEINRYAPLCGYNGGSAVKISECGYNGGTAIMFTADCTLSSGTIQTIHDCTLSSGTVVVIHNCTFNGGSAIILYDCTLSSGTVQTIHDCTLSGGTIIVQ